MSCHRYGDLTSVLLEFPISVVEWADLAGFQPTGDAVEVESMVAYTPSHGTLLAGGGSLVGLTFNAKIHNMVSTDSTVIDDDIPSPKSYSVPFLDFEALFGLCTTF